jgi:hypothetical protein
VFITTVDRHNTKSQICRSLSKTGTRYVLYRHYLLFLQLVDNALSVTEVTELNDNIVNGYKSQITEVTCFIQV